MYNTDYEDIHPYTCLEQLDCSICKGNIDQVEDVHYSRGSKDYCWKCIEKISERFGENVCMDDYVEIEALNG